jgi:uncharacterized membrane protein
MLAPDVSEREFLEPAAKRRTAEVVRSVETQTAVEVVVAVRRRASHYVVTSLLFGLACAVGSFVIMWFGPTVYDVRTIPLDVALAFVVGTALVASVPTLRRALTPRSVRLRSAQRAAQAAFSALGGSRRRAVAAACSCTWRCSRRRPFWYRTAGFRLAS